MKPVTNIVTGLLLAAACVLARPGPSFVKRAVDFNDGQPTDGQGKGSIILGGTDPYIDKQNPDNLGRQSTDNGLVPNLKWRLSDSKARVFDGGWLRSQVIQDLPQSHDISAVQQHLTGGSIRELHWHRVAEWGFVYAGKVIVSAVDEHGQHQVETLGFGDIWYFPKGVAHTVQGLEDENEFLLVFDEPNFDDDGQTFNINDWLIHTPKDVLARNFNVSESVFDDFRPKTPFIHKGERSNRTEVTGGGGSLNGDAEGTFVYRTLQHEPEAVPGGGGTFYKIDSTNFPVSETIAATFVTLKPGGLRELHWHPNAEEWLFFHSGHAKATVFTGNENARTFDFQGGDTAAFPDNSGHYIENTSDTEDLVWIEIYKSDRVADIPLAQWLALTPSDIVAQTLQVPIEFVEGIKKDKQVLL